MTRTSLLVLASLAAISAAAAVAEDSKPKVLGSWTYEGYVIEFRCFPPVGDNPPKCQHQAVKVPPAK